MESASGISTLALPWASVMISGRQISVSGKWRRTRTALAPAFLPLWGRSIDLEAGAARSITSNRSTCWTAAIKGAEAPFIIKVIGRASSTTGESTTPVRASQPSTSLVLDSGRTRPLPAAAMAPKVRTIVPISTSVTIIPVISSNQRG